MTEKKDSRQNKKARDVLPERFAKLIRSLEVHKTELEIQNSELRKRQKELEKLISLIRHDLGNPLLSIQAFSSEIARASKDVQGLLQSQNIDDDAKVKLSSAMEKDIPSFVDFIQDAVKQMYTLLESLKQLAVVGRVSINIKTLNMNKLIKNVIDAMMHQFRDSGISLSIEKLPGCLGDVDQVKRVFTNLLTNAVKYIPSDREGRIEVWGKVAEGRCIYCVEDNGIGIEPENQGKVFDFFYRFAPNGSVRGEGLGLPMVCRILERQNGKIWLESEPGKGSRFFVSLPNQKS